MHSLAHRSNTVHHHQSTLYNGKDEDDGTTIHKLQYENKNDDTLTSQKEQDTEKVSSVNTSRRQKERLSEEEYVVEKIVDRRLVPDTNDEYEYKVKWKGYEEKDNTWQSLSSLKNAMQSVIDYEKERQERDIGR